MTDWKELIVNLLFGGLALVALHYLDRWLHWRRESRMIGKLSHAERGENDGTQFQSDAQ